MPITPTFPGIYIEEIPSTARTITPAPTSIAVFVGYTHPFRTASFGEAVLIFSFSDYERAFGGFFSSGRISGDVAYAVNDFFINGGSIAYVVGLKPRAHFSVASGLPVADLLPPKATVGTIDFTGREPVDATPMNVDVAAAAGGLTAVITITYGTRVEVFRDVSLDPNSPAFIEKALSGSALVTVSPASGGYGSTFTSGTQTLIDSQLNVQSTFDVSDFSPVFQAESSLDKVDIFNLLLVPGRSDNSVLSAALAFAERKRAFMIMDPKPNVVADTSLGPLVVDVTTDFRGTVTAPSTVPKSPNGAIYFPYLKSQHPVTGAAIILPPSGFVAGIYARTDTNRGVWKAPAGLETTVLNTTGVVPAGRMTDMRQGVLNQAGINAIRSFPGIGTVVFGARTLTAENPSYQPWKYVPVRRTALFIEQTLYRELKWAIFEPNDEPLWVALRISVGNFMMSLFSQGAFQGSKPSQAFVVKCDSTTTTQDDIDNGVVNIIVGFRPLKPAEFVFVKIMQLAGQVQS